MNQKHVIAFQLWPIFAPGGEYGPKYDVMDDEYEDDMSKRSNTEIFVDALTKKDLESLLHQPDPSLTVQELPQNPKISFRKGNPFVIKDMTRDFSQNIDKMSKFLFDFLSNIRTSICILSCIMNVM